MLRGYQQDIYNKIRHELLTHNGVCAVLPCRSGKSYIMKEIVDRACEKGNNVLILAHRHLLINQHKRLIGNCRIASVFTEVNHLGEYIAPQLIIIDEAHLSGAETYQKICNYYKCKRILFTATAKRLDNKPLNLADTIINGISADELIKLGYVSNYDLYAPKLDINLKSVSMSGSDFNNEELAGVMMERKIYGDIIAYYNKLANGLQALAYCVNVAHSKSICELFNANGISARHIDAKTPENEREQIMNEFKEGKFKILCNCNLINEGITLPECDCCLLLRPTQSESLYIQQSCRCLTPRENKRAIIIDYVGNCYAHGTPTEKRVYKLTKQKIRNPSREKDIITRACENCLRVYPGNGPICPYCGHDNKKTQKQIEIEQKAELERITEINRKKARMEVGMARDYASLVALATRRGYKNPSWWAKTIIESRKRKLAKW